MEFNRIRLEVKYLSDNYVFQNDKMSLIKVFCSDVISGKEISVVEFKFYTQLGRNDPVVVQDWTSMTSSSATIYKYELTPTAWASTEDGRMAFRITYDDGSTQIETLEYKFEVEA